MSFELPEMCIRPEFCWGPPEEEMTIDGEPFSLYFKTDALQAFPWYVQERNDEDADDEESDRVGKKRNDGQFVVVQDEVRIKALKNEKAKTGIKKKKNFSNNQNNKGAKGGKNMGQNKRQYQPRRLVTELPSTIAVSTDVTIYARHTQSDLQKVKMDHLPKVEEISTRGQPLIYNASMDDAASCKRPFKLDESDMSPDYYNRCFPTDDPVIRDLLRRETGNHTVFFTSDEVLATLMTSSRSICPWHINVVRVGNRPLLVLSNERDPDSAIDQQWVCETGDREIRPSEGPKGDENNTSALGNESTVAHESYIKASCTKSRAQIKVDDKNPFPRTQPRMYRYRRFIMHADTPDRYDIIVRCDVDAMTSKNEAVRIFGLLEYVAPEKQSEWPAMLASNPSALIPMEFRHNACKISRWTALSILSNVDVMKIGFIRRANTNSAAAAAAAKNAAAPTENSKEHVVVSVQSDRPAYLAAQLGIRAANMWAIVDSILQSFIAHPEYTEAVIMKPSSTNEIHVIEPEEEEEDDDDDEDDDEDDDDDDEDEDDE